ncbi:MAG: GNAT family N-acetyltransferase [Cetobacterium sp.]|nr:GNAT family N-acetyltransferase [Cetobacterium sp.]
MEIRYSKKSEREISEKIWLETFKDSEDYVKWYMENIHRNENNLYILKEEKVLGMLYENPYNINYLNENLRGIYAVAVSIIPEARGEGNLNRLMEYSIKNNRNKDIMFLHPVNGRLYKKYGFIYGSNIETYTCLLKDIPFFRKKYKVFSIDKKNDINYLVKLYEEKMKNYKFFIKKTEKDLLNLFSETEIDKGYSYLIKDENNIIKGYFTYTFNENNIFVKEMIFEDKNTFESILYHLKTYGDYFEKLEIVSPEGMNLNKYLEDYTILKKEIKPHIQFRILNVEIFLKNLKYKFIKSNFILEIKDNILGDSLYKIFNGEIEKNIKGSPDISLTIEEFTEIISSDISYDIMEKKLENKKLFLLKDIFIERKSFINQFF